MAVDVGKERSASDNLETEFWKVCNKWGNDRKERVGRQAMKREERVCERE